MEDDNDNNAAPRLMQARGMNDNKDDSPLFNKNENETTTTTTTPLRADDNKLSLQPQQRESQQREQQDNETREQVSTQVDNDSNDGNDDNNEEEGEEVEPFVNEGFRRWEESRAQWLFKPQQATQREYCAQHDEEKDIPSSSHTEIPIVAAAAAAAATVSTSSSSSSYPSASAAAIPIPVDAIIDVIFSNRWKQHQVSSSSSSSTTTNCSFAQPVPLPQMVDILVDLWEAEGLDI